MDVSGTLASPSGVAQFAFRLWGRFAARRQPEGEDLTPRGRKSRALLAHLLVAPEPVPRDRLADLLWSERGQAQAFGSLRQAILELRDFAPILEVDRHQVGLVRSALVTDLDSMRATIHRGDAGALASQLAEGSALLEGLDGADPAFDEWLRSIRSAQGESLLSQALDCGRRALDAGDAESAARLARRLIEVDPLDEAAVRLAMESAHRAGKHDAVERIHAQLVDRLRRDLGVAPSPETEGLHAQLVARAAPAARKRAEASEPPGFGPRVTDADPAAVSPAAAGPTGRRRWWAAGGVFLVVAAALLALVMGTDLFRGQPPPSSLAVLPFRNLSPGEDYFAEGVAEEILSRLAREPQMQVAGRSSSWMFDDPGVDVRDVGRRLDVAYVLEGAVRRSGDRVRVDVALVGTDSGMRIWSQVFQGSLDDIFAIQGRIGTEVAARLSQRLVSTAPTSGPLTTTGAVYNLYLTARGLLRSREPARMEAAIGLLRSAVELDPNYAPAWAALGRAVMLSSQDPRVTETDSLKAEASRHIARSLRLAPDLAEAHHAQGLLRNWDPSSLPALERAVRLEPRNPEFWYGLYQARSQALDFEGALAAVRRVVQIDPFWIRAAALSTATWKLGYPDEAIRFQRRIARDHPEPLARELALARLAMMQRDWSGTWLHIRRADRLVPMNSQARSDPDPTFVAIRLGLISELRQTPPIALRIIGGEAPPLAEMRAFFRSDRAIWQVTPVKAMLARLYLKAGRAADLVALYDGAFRSPEDMAANHPVGMLDFLLDAPAVAVALRQVGRSAEAARLLDLTEAAIARIRTRRLPFEYYEAFARTWAVRGRREQALRALELAVARGWQFEEHGLVPLLAEEPVYQSLRNEPRLRRLDRVIQSNVARERREVRAQRN